MTLLLGKTEEELTNIAGTLGEPAYRGRQLSPGDLRSTHLRF
jgi:hypothetical protein